MDVSIIIINYNTKAFTKDCISSIFEHTKDVNFEVIVVDNASTDGSVELLEQDARILLIKSGANLGFGRANNIGFEQARGKYVFLLNSDTLLLNNAVKVFLDFANHTPINFGAIGCVLLNANGVETHSVVDFKSIPRLIKFAIKKLVQKVFSLPPSFVQAKLNGNSYQEVDGVIGADMFIPSTVYKAVGGFDPAYFMYGEEVDLQKRMDKLGFKRLVIRGPEIIHYEGGSSDNLAQKLSCKTVYNLQKGALYFVKRHRSRTYYNLYKFVLLFTWFPWVLIDKRFKLKEKRLLFNLIKSS
ncbi:glycosyltransferase family 2 protein [Pedobacter sp.]|uniref:glycosyltransferase family 2 protein n=1 Tax=Pedobacter sp. TaxID=1411316 RepID=UPI003D7F1957